MNQQDLVERVCVRLNDFKQITKDRVNLFVPDAVEWVMGKYQWECRTKYTTKDTDGVNDYIDPPDDFSKEIKLWRSGLTKPIDYITPEKYGDLKAQSDTPFGEECVRFTIMGGETLKDKRIYFLDAPTSVITIKMLYSIAIDTSNIELLPNQFIPVIIACLLFWLTPPFFERAEVKYTNASFQTTERDFRKSFGDTVSFENANRGRVDIQELSDIDQRAYQHYHR